MSNLLIVQLSLKEIERNAQELIRLVTPLSQEQLWSEEHGIPNSIGTLIRHLTGNFNHYFGAGVLKNGYIRDRDKEFSEIDLAKEVIIAELITAVSITKKAVSQIDEEMIFKPYTTPCGANYESFAYHVIRLATHFSLHLGQVDYAINILQAR